MSKSKHTKEELRQPDTFLTFSDKLMKMVEANAKPFVTVFLVIMIAGILYGGADYLNKQTESKSQEAFFKANYEMEKMKAELFKQSLKKVENTKDSKDKKTTADSLKPEMNKTPAELEKHFSKVITSFKQVITEHDGASGSVSAAITLSHLFSEYQSDDKALEALNDVKDLNADSIYFSLYHIRKGELHMQLEQWQQAVDAFDKVVSEKKSEFAHPVALLKQGLAYEKLGDNDAAMGAYERIVADYKKSTSVESARVYLNLLKFKKAQ